MAQPCPISGSSPAADPAQPRKERWNAQRTRIFLDHLAMTCNVNEALEMSGMSPSSLYRRRRECAEFRRGWDEALAEGYSRLEAELLNRAINGEMQEVVNRNGEVVAIRKFSNTLGLALIKLRAIRAAALDKYDGRSANGKSEEEQALDVKMKLLKRINQIIDHREEQAARGEPPPVYQY